ncbi:carbon-nitrogen hydrolase family protein [Agrobacterium burrii]|uniref:Carbon-nitrogen hydrolase family protein n=1 Tax=Agrobacterium burrii TaxID=2815339 RepID=A0ABS3EJU9_9HYPH|nr:carbon-nitrogen hydrolase family protein [Agrobacterium burrii]MBO0132272.1 carbon-nitrogen hydrolase family protein [Agrobacterium burrii]
MPREVKISACQYYVREIREFDDLAGRVRALLDLTSGSDIAVFPELFTIELFTTFKDWQTRPISELGVIDEYTQAYKALFRDEAKKRGQFIAAGSHLEQVSDGRFENIAYIFGPDGEVFSHVKTHIFPAEANWNTAEGNRMEAIQLPFAKVGFNVCYETEIPECSSSLVEQGAEIILTPSATFTEQGFWRVRHCAQSRCIENQVYLVHSCLGGQPGAPLPNAWARSSVLGPCDLAWKNPAGIIAEAEANVETVATGTVNLDLLYENRLKGAAPTYRDRRRQVALYQSWPSHIRA